MAEKSQNLERTLTYRERRQQKETTVFTVLGIIMAIVAATGILIGFGIVPFPFFNDFSEKEKIATIGSIPCPLGESDYIKPDQIEIILLNGTDQQGLARDTSDKLKERGFKVSKIANTPSGEFTGSARITVGATGVNKAHTVAKLFPESRIEFDGRDKPTVTVTLGEDYADIVLEEEFKRSIQGKIQKVPGCLPVIVDD